jgi:hypothetical protein
MAKLMRLAALFARVKTGFKSRGFDYLLEAGLNLLPHNLLFFERNLLMVADTCNVPVRCYADCEVRLVTPEDLPKITGFSFSLERLQRELREGSVGVVVLKKGRVVTWRWAATGALYVEYCNTVLNTGDDGYYSSRLETIPEERFKGYANTCLRTMHEYFKALNRRLNYTLIAANDLRSRKMHERIGFRTIGDIFMLNIFWLHFCFYRKWPFHDKRVALYVRIPPAGTRIV